MVRLFWGYFQCVFSKTNRQLEGLASVTKKMGPSEPDKYSNNILPRRSRDYSFAETVETLK